VDEADRAYAEAAAFKLAISRARAGWTLAQMEATDQLGAIEAALKSEKEPAARPRIALAVWRLRKDGAGLVEVVRAGLRDPSQFVRICTTEAIIDFGPDASALVPDLEAAMEGDEGVLRDSALEAFRVIGSPSAPSVPAILKVMEANPHDLPLQRLCLRALAAIGTRSDAVIAAIRKADEEFRNGNWYYPREALRKLGAK